MSAAQDAVADRMLGSLLGGIVCDAFGATYEFRPRDTYTVAPNMQYVKTYDLPAGSFTDDSSMMLCLAASLSECNAFVPLDQIKRYADWYQRGYMSAAPERGCFDIGRATREAIRRYIEHQKQHTTDAPSPERQEQLYFGSDNKFASGNGGIMRLAPVPVYYWRYGDEAIEYCRLSSKVTHASAECLDAAALMGRILLMGINGASKQDMLDNADFEDRVTSASVKALCRGEYKSKTRDAISTSGYVIHTLEAALWAFNSAPDFTTGALTLAAMGDDVDTVCCVYGQIAGSHWGTAALPQQWLKVSSLFVMMHTI
ncbi:hypothetical protein RI367_006851 [Sorochytrium milnesiophthora]